MNIKQERIKRELGLMDRFSESVEAQLPEPEEFPIKVKRSQIRWQGGHGIELKGGRFLLLENVEIVD